MGLAKSCSAHANRNYAYGHPLGVPIPRDIYKQELDEVTQLFGTNKTHPGLESLKAWIDNWIDKASRQEAPEGNNIFNRIHLKRLQGKTGLTALDIIIEIEAVWLFSHRYPQRLPDDQRLTYALARNVARLATLEKVRYGKYKNTKQPLSSELKGTGTRIRQTLALFHLNVIEALERKARDHEQFRQSLSIPFS